MRRRSGPGPRLARAGGAAALMLLGLALLAPPAGALEAPPSHNFLFSLRGFLKEPGKIPVPPPEGEFEDACGVAVDSFGDIYLSDYYHHVIDVYSPGREYLTQIADPDPDGPCNLAVDSTGRLYVNHWRRDVLRYTPSEFPPTTATTYGPGMLIDDGHGPDGSGERSTGVAIDPASGNLYVDDRTYVAVYEPSGEPVLSEGEPIKIGLGSLGSGYGVAVSDFASTEGYVYVLDTASDTVKVYDPATSLLNPVQIIDGAGTPQEGFNSLLDSNVLLDPSNGHLYVADNIEPGFERPAAVVDEFNAEGDYRGQLPQALIDAEPSALALDGAGNVYVTSGNDEEAVLYAFGPTVSAHALEVAKTGTGEGTVSSEPAGINCGTACRAEYNVGSEVILAATPAPGSAFAGWSGGGCSGTGLCHLILGADTTVNAEFEALPQPLGLAGAASLSATAPSAATAATANSPALSPLHRHTRRRPRHRRNRHKAHRLQARSVGR